MRILIFTFLLSLISAGFLFGKENADIKKVAYVNDVSKVMAETAAQVDNDPIIQLLNADENIDLDVLLVANDSVIDLSGYDAVIAQEGFGSSSAIFKPGGSLGMGSIPVPFVLNKTYTMKAGRGFAADTPGSGGEVEGTLYLTASAANQVNPLFNGITFDGDSVQMFYTGAADNGDDTKTKGLQYATDVVISAENTLLASGVNDPVNATVCVNDIPAGTTIGSETLQARMIALGMNYGAICKDGNNLTSAGLTLWRNAVYSLVGLDVPAEAVVISTKIDSIKTSAGSIAISDDAKAVQLILPVGVSTADISVYPNDPKAIVTIESDKIILQPVVGLPIVYSIDTHIQSADEILFVSGDSRGVLAGAGVADLNIYNTLVDEGYSVTFLDKLALNDDGFDYSPYTALVIGAGVGSSWVNNYAEDGYPLPCVSMQSDGPRSDKWGWTGSKKSGDAAGQMMVTKNYDTETCKIKITNNLHPITAGYTVGQLIQWTDGTADSTEWAGKEIKSYTVSDSIPEAIALATIADATMLSTIWAIPAGVSARSRTSDGTYAKAEIANNIVWLGIFNNGLNWMNDAFKPLLLNSLDWAINGGEVTNESGLVSHWKFEEGSIEVKDEVTGATGTVLNSDGVAWINGPAGKAIDLTNATDSAVIMINDSEKLQPINFTDGSLTLSVLVKFDPAAHGDQAQQEIFMNGSNNHVDGGAGANGTRYEMYAKNGGIFFAIDDDVNKTQLTMDQTNYVAGEWAHLVGVRDTDAGMLKFYCNGLPAGEIVDKSAAIDVDTIPVIMGNYWNLTNKVIGAMDDVQIYNKALTADEIADIYNGYDFTPVIPKEIVFVKNPATNYDSIVVATLSAMSEYNVTVIEQTVITEDLLPQFNAADVVIMGRSIPSGDVASGMAVWDEITAPVLSMNMWGMRSSRALWTPSSSCENVVVDVNQVLQAEILVDDPVFEGITGTIDWWTGYYSVFGIDAEGDDHGNGTLLAKTPDGRMMFARWEKGVEFYNGAGHAPKGPRTYIGNGNDNTATNYFAFTDDAKKIFFNELARMAALERVAPKEIVFVKNADNNRDSIVIAAIDAMPEYNVTVVAQNVITEDLLPQFNAANVVIMGRSIPSGDVKTGTDVWSAIKAPVLSMNMWGMRSSRALWTPSASCENLKNDSNVFFQGTILLPGDPAFEGVSAETIDWWSGNYSAFGPDAEGDDAGNGTLLAQTTDGRALFMRWAAGEMYPGGAVAQGPRSYIGNGSDDGGVDNYFAFSEDAKKIFFNELASLASYERPKEIVFVKHAENSNDSIVIAAIDAMPEYNVTVIAQNVITEDLLPQFNAANVVIMGRSLPSGDVKAGTDVWNKIAAPVLSMNMWGMRSSRALWTPSASCENLKNDSNVFIQGTILMPKDPVFEGVSAETIDWWAGNHSAFGPDAEGDDAGNGTLLAQTADGRALFMRWEAGVEMYPGGSVPQGVRSYIGNGSDDGGIINYFAFSEEAEKIFFNELARMAVIEYEVPQGDPLTIFDPAEVDESALPEGMSIVDMDGTPYLQVILNGWNSNLPIPAYSIPEDGMAAVGYMKYTLGAGATYSSSKVNAVVQLMDTINLVPASWDPNTMVPAALGLMQTGPDGSMYFASGKLMKEMKRIHNIQFFGQETVTWGPTTGDTIWVGKIRAQYLEENVIFDPRNVDTSDENVSIVEIDGEQYAKIILQGWNSVLKVPTFTLSEGMTAKCKLMYELGAGSPNELSKINGGINLHDIVNLVKNPWGEGMVPSATTLAQYPVDGKMTELSGALVPEMKLVHQVQLFGQETVSWGPTTGDVMYLGKVVAEAAPEIAKITFVIDDTKHKKYDGFELKGSWKTASGEYDSKWDDGAKHAQFTDDNKDNIWELTVELVADGGANTWEWGFVDLSDTWLVTGSNPQFNVVDGTAQTITYVIGATGIDAISSSNLKVYPNPTSGVLHINGIDAKTIEVYNLSGAKVSSNQISSNSIDVSNLAKGSYIVKVTSTQGGSAIRKFNKR